MSLAIHRIITVTEVKSVTAFIDVSWLVVLIAMSGAIFLLVTVLISYKITL